MNKGRRDCADFGCAVAAATQNAPAMQRRGVHSTAPQVVDRARVDVGEAEVPEREGTLGVAVAGEPKDHQLLRRRLLAILRMT